MSDPNKQMAPVAPAMTPTALPAGETASMVLASQAKALVEARYLVAMKKPRDLDVVREGILKECKRPGFAKVCRYKKPVGKKKDDKTGKWEQNYVEGPSIRFVEAALRNMTNILSNNTAIYDDHEKRIVRVQVMDLEANLSYDGDVSVRKQLERSSIKDTDVVISSRMNSQNKLVYLIEASDEQIADKLNAQISKMLRTLGLRLIPGDIIEEAMDLAIEVEAKADAQDPDAARKQLFDAFAKQGVNVAQIKEFLGHDGTTLTPKEMVDLRATYNAIKDGETTWREIMGDRKEDGKGDTKPPVVPAAAAPNAANGAARPDGGPASDDPEL